jgi:uncharacterized membrane protein YkvA (DUF1232 family)
VTVWQWTLVGLAATAVLYAAFVGVLLVAGRRSDAAALARFIPDCVVLFRRLLGDPRLSRWRKATVAALIAYLASPIDLIPDLIPVVGLLDDAILVALVLRIVLRGAGRQLVEEHWPGPQESLSVILRLASAGGDQRAAPARHG